MNNSHHPIIGLTLNYRDADRTIQCVNSLLAEGATHVLVWDNSADSGSSAASLSQKLGNNPKISLEISTINLGFAAGVNQSVQWINTRFSEPWILILNNDARLLPRAIKYLENALIEQIDAVVAYPDIDNAGRVNGTNYYQRHTGLLTTSPLPGSFAYASGCCQLIATERINLPIFDDAFFMYGEDTALGATLGTERMVHVHKTLVFHEGSISSGQGSIFYETHMAAAHWILARKLARSQVDLALLLSLRLFTLSARAGLRALRFRSLSPVLALFLGWRIAHKQ